MRIPVLAHVMDAIGSVESFLIGVTTSFGDKIQSIETAAVRWAATFTAGTLAYTAGMVAITAVHTVGVTVGAVHDWLALHVATAAGK
jgi:uncharacterized membrane protein